MKTWKEVTELISKQNTLIQTLKETVEVQKRIMKNDDEIIDTQSHIIASLYESNNLLEQQVDMLKEIINVKKVGTNNNH